MDRRALSFLPLVIFCSPLSIQRVAGQEPQLQQHFTISEDSTRLTFPLTKEGYVNYSAAIDAMNWAPQSTNAAADLIQMVGAPGYWEPAQVEVLKVSLGLDELPGGGSMLMTRQDYSNGLQKSGQTVPTEAEKTDQWKLARNQPWTKDQAPFIYNWIEANSQYLSKVDAILEKPDFFEPLEYAVPDFPLSPGIVSEANRVFSYLLIARSHLHAGEGRYQSAVEDMLRIHKLSRLGKNAQLTTQDFDTVEMYSMETGQKLVNSADLDSAALQSFLDGLNQLEPMTLGRDRCQYRRYFHLAAASSSARMSPKEYIGQVGLDQRFGNNAPYCCEVTSDQIDWDDLLSSINKRFDRLEEIYAVTDAAERYRLIRELTDAAQTKSFNFDRAAEYGEVFKKDPGEAKRRLTDDLDGVLNQWLDCQTQAWYDYLCNLNMDLLRLAVAAKLYETQHGKLPENCEAIEGYFETVPLDPVSGKHYRWKSTDDGLEISSASSDDEELPSSIREVAVVVRTKSGDASQVKDQSLGLS